jgi:hypothetical protein
MNDTPRSPGTPLEVPAAGFYEPWTFKVGDRVRCVPSPECRVAWEIEVEAVGHPDDEYGALGTVALVGRSERDGHRFKVDWDQERIWRGDWWYAAWYAAVELELISDAAEGEA